MTASVPHPRPRAGAALRAAGALATAGLLAFSLSACAPEPGDEVAGSVGKDGTTEDGAKSWPEAAPEEATQKTTELDPDFPQDLLAVPDGAVIDDNGVLEDGRAFIVFRADDDTAAAELWNRIVEGGGFTAQDEAETTEGGLSALLVKSGVEVTALTLPQEDGAVLLSYDIVRTAA